MRKKQQRPSQAGLTCNARITSQSLISQGDEATSAGTGPCTQQQENRKRARLNEGGQRELLPWQEGNPFWQVWQKQPEEQQARQQQREAQRRCLMELEEHEHAAGGDDGEDSEDAWGELAPPRVRRRWAGSTLRGSGHADPFNMTRLARGQQQQQQQQQEQRQEQQPIQPQPSGHHRRAEGAERDKVPGVGAPAPGPAQQAHLPELLGSDVVARAQQDLMPMQEGNQRQHRLQRSLQPEEMISRRHKHSTSHRHHHLHHHLHRHRRLKCVSQRHHHRHRSSSSSSSSGTDGSSSGGDRSSSNSSSSSSSSEDANSRGEEDEQIAERRHQGQVRRRRRQSESQVEQVVQPGASLRSSVRGDLGSVRLCIRNGRFSIFNRGTEDGLQQQQQQHRRQQATSPQQVQQQQVQVETQHRELSPHLPPPRHSRRLARGGSSSLLGRGVEEGVQPGLRAPADPPVQLPQPQLVNGVEFGGDLTRSSDEEDEACVAPAAGKGAKRRAKGGALTTLMSAAAALSGDAALPDEQACVICLSAPRQIGYLHGNSVHLSACKECADRLARRGSHACPICRSPSKMVDVYL